MKVQMIFDSQGPKLRVESESELEAQMMQAAFQDHELKASVAIDINRDPYRHHSDKARSASLVVKLMID